MQQAGCSKFWSLILEVWFFTLTKSAHNTGTQRIWKFIPSSCSGPGQVGSFSTPCGHSAIQDSFCHGALTLFGG